MTPREAANNKNSFLGKLLDDMEANLRDLEEKYRERTINLVLDNLAFTDDNVDLDSNVSSLTTRLITFFRTLTDRSTISFIGKVAKGVDGYNKLAERYFVTVSDKTADKIKSARKKANKSVLDNLGIRISSTGEIKIAKGSQMDRIRKLEDIQDDVLQAVREGVTGGISRTEMRERISDSFADKRRVNTLSDSLIKQTRAATVAQGAEIGLESYYLINGTRRKNSRKYCIGGTEKKSGKKWPGIKGKVFTANEMKKWVDINWNGKNTHNYNPFICIGGHNCVDIGDPISYTVAKRLRPNVPPPEQAGKMRD